MSSMCGVLATFGANSRDDRKQPWLVQSHRSSSVANFDYPLRRHGGQNPQGMSSTFGMNERNDFVTTHTKLHSFVIIAMARQLALPPTLAPRLISREASAAYVSVSPTTFDEMVQDGRMPHPKRLGERRMHGMSASWMLQLINCLAWEAVFRPRRNLE